MRMLVARIGKPHGLRGEATVQVHTDAPEQRFVVGATFETEPASAGPLTLRSVREHNGITLLGFDELPDRTAVEGARNVRLFVDVSDDTDLAGSEGSDGSDGSEEFGDDEGYYEDELLDLAVVTADGRHVGTVAALHTRPAQDLLAVALTNGQEALIPFVEEIVPEVDLEAGRVVIDPPPGLLELSGFGANDDAEKSE